MSIGLARISFPLCLCAIFGLSQIPATARSEISGLEKLEKPIEQNESNLEKIEQGMQMHLGKLLVVSEKEFDLLGQIEKIDRNLRLQRIRLDIMVERLNNQEELLALKKQNLEEAEINKKRVRNHLEKRLHSYYLMGKTGVLNVTFSSKTLPDLMLLNDSYKTMLGYDKRLFEKFRVSIEQLTQARDAHEKESILLAEFIDKAVKQQQELDSLLVEKRDLLERIKTQKILHEQAIKELKKAEEELRLTLIRLKRERDDAQKGFLLNKGSMPPPAKGKLLTKFGETSTEGLSTGAANGITIEVPDGSAIKSIFYGQVLFAGYKKGYGNMVIIDHGLDYYTITSRMEKIEVKEGQEVKKGDIIGIAGDIATLFEKGIYFEIRQGSTPLDPFDWITKEGLEL